MVQLLFCLILFLEWKSVLITSLCIIEILLIFMTEVNFQLGCEFGCRPSLFILQLMVKLFWFYAAELDLLWIMEIFIEVIHSEREAPTNARRIKICLWCMYPYCRQCLLNFEAYEAICLLYGIAYWISKKYNELHSWQVGIWTMFQLICILYP